MDTPTVILAPVPVPCESVALPTVLVLIPTTSPFWYPVPRSEAVPVNVTTPMAPVVASTEVIFNFKNELLSIFK